MDHFSTANIAPGKSALFRVYRNERSTYLSSKAVSVVKVPRVKEDKAALHCTLFAESIHIRLGEISTQKMCVAKNAK